MIGRIAKFLASVGIVAAVLYLADPQAVLSRLSAADPIWLCFAGLGLTLVTMLMALRWKLVAGSLGLRFGMTHAVREYYYSNLTNQIVPGGVVGDASRAVRQRADQGLPVAAKSVIIERLVGQCVLMGILSCGFAIAFLIPGGIAWPLWAVTAICVGTLGLALVALSGVLPQRFAFARDLKEALTDPAQLALSLTIAFLLVMSFYACARATGTLLPPEAVFTTIPLILTAMIIPLSVGGWGWREGAAALLFPLAGATAEAGVAAGVAYGAISLITALPALAFLVTKSSFASGGLALAKDKTHK